MRLIIHMGCHKTATTSFQKTCHAISKKLANVGVIYDTRNDCLSPPDQHSELAWQIGNGDIDLFKSLLLDFSHRDDVHSIILSGEDFENFIVQIHIARYIEQIAFNCGVSEVQWKVVFRDPFSYFNSIYAQISGSPAIISYGDAADAALETGYLNVGRLTRNWIFVFDLARYIPRFQAAVEGHVELIPFERFVIGGPGRILLDRLLGSDMAGNFLSEVPDTVLYSNSGKQKNIVEMDYAKRFLGLRWRHMFEPWERIFGRLLLRPLVWHRIRQRRSLERIYEQRFREKFSAPITSGGFSL